MQKSIRHLAEQNQAQKSKFVKFLNFVLGFDLCALLFELILLYPLTALII